MPDSEYLPDDPLPADGAPDPDGAPSPDAETPEPTVERGTRRTAVLLLAVLILVPLLLVLSGGFDLLAQSILLRLTNTQPAIEATDVRPVEVNRRAATYTFEESALHPHRLYPEYFEAELERLPLAAPSTRLVTPFRDLLDVYITRQGRDDNFTVRVLDQRTGETLEVYELDDEKARYQRTGTANWGAIDKLRREQTRRLVDKYAARGIPRQAISVKWGRADQVREARRREAPFIDYEVRLARLLGLSLLVTEIGTVETFNDDRLVSSVGARSRYQMMPYLLRKNNIQRYRLKTAYGNRIDVYEEWHPMLTMEPAFTLVRGYANAVGHEIPGISAYHTGPGNLFTLYRMFLTEAPELIGPGTTVVDAYLWALTEGYDTVSSRTSFKEYSRGYLPSGYGALRATESIPVDTVATFLAERVQLAPGKKVYLSDLLDGLEASRAMLHWGPMTDVDDLYERFRRLNPHIHLPAPAEGGGVPARGDVLLTREAGDAPVRFFLPLNASDVLALSGLDVFDDDATFRYDRNTYRPPRPSERTVWDEQYERLVEDIAHFGFTQANRQQLLRLDAKFRELAEANPDSRYRQLQRDVIRTHRELWSFAGWERLSEAANAVRGQLRLPARPPTTIQRVPPRPPTPRTDQ
ncbi:MAG: hypothetical protein R3247_00195 [Rhodothermales bacterium]|nr:hypothetical protein [Rhodothermales bacterium]